MFNWKSWFGSSKKSRFVNLSFYRDPVNFYRVKMVWEFDIIVIKSKRNDLCHVMISDDQGQFFKPSINLGRWQRPFHV